MASCTEKHNTVGHSIGRMLLRHGIHEFFGQGLPQGLSLPFEELGLRQIAYRTENGGGYMADGYARVSKRPEVYENRGDACGGPSCGSAEILDSACGHASGDPVEE